MISNLTSLWAWSLLGRMGGCLPTGLTKTKPFRFLHHRVEKCMRGLENLARLRLDYVKVDGRTAVSKATVGFFFRFFFSHSVCSDSKVSARLRSSVEGLFVLLSCERRKWLVKCQTQRKKVPATLLARKPDLMSVNQYLA